MLTFQHTGEVENVGICTGSNFLYHGHWELHNSDLLEGGDEAGEVPKVVKSPLLQWHLHTVPAHLNTSCPMMLGNFCFLLYFLCNVTVDSHV